MFQCKQNKNRKEICFGLINRVIKLITVCDRYNANINPHAQALASTFRCRVNISRYNDHKRLVLVYFKHVNSKLFTPFMMINKHTNIKKPSKFIL